MDIYVDRCRKRSEVFTIQNICREKNVRHKLDLSHFAKLFSMIFWGLESGAVEQGADWWRLDCFPNAKFITLSSLLHNKTIRWLMSYFIHSSQRAKDEYGTYTPSITNITGVSFYSTFTEGFFQPFPMCLLSKVCF